MISDGIKDIEVKVILMKILNFKDFLKKNILEDDTMDESQLQKIYNYPLYPPDSRLYSDGGFVNIDDGSQRGSHWTSLIVKDNESYYFESFGGALDKSLLNQLPKPIIYHNYKIQDINSKLCGSNCLYFFYLYERMNYYYTTLKMYFDEINNAGKCFRKQFFFKQQLK